MAAAATAFSPARGDGSRRRIGSYNHEMNQLHGRHATNIAVDIDGRRNFFLIPRWPSPDLMVDHSSYSQRTSYRGNSSYQSVGSETNLVDFGLPAGGRVVPPRYPGHPSLQGHMNERNGSLRIRDDADEGIGHSRWVSEDLLALEERIGNVNTGLSEGAISRCLMETIYCSDQTPGDHEKGRCTICLVRFNKSFHKTFSSLLLLNLIVILYIMNRKHTREMTVLGE
ncbi:hypothetical protein BHM03_00035738 [Ensete ventricosum]|nr:hypothetical protein BHM03_00035738 [Ensete ventricosum]